MSSKLSADRPDDKSKLAQTNRLEAYKQARDFTKS